MSKKEILIISGPNLNLLGAREENIYGKISLSKIYGQIEKTIDNDKFKVHCKQSNSESEIIDWIQNAYDKIDGIIINAGGYTHTSIAIRDALKFYNGYIVEIHMSNIHAREEFRHNSMISGVSHGIIIGFGARSYFLAIHALETHFIEDKIND